MAQLTPKLKTTKPQNVLLKPLTADFKALFKALAKGVTHGLPDYEALSAASRDGRILVSHDRNTMPAHFSRFTADSISAGLLIVPQERRDDSRGDRPDSDRLGCF